MTLAEATIMAMMLKRRYIRRASWPDNLYIQFGFDDMERPIPILSDSDYEITSDDCDADDWLIMEQVNRSNDILPNHIPLCGRVVIDLLLAYPPRSQQLHGVADNHTGLWSHPPCRGPSTTFHHGK